MIKPGRSGLLETEVRVTPGWANRLTVLAYRVLPHGPLLPLLARRVTLAARNAGKGIVEVRGRPLARQGSSGGA